MDVCFYPSLGAQGQKGTPDNHPDPRHQTDPTSTLGEHFHFLPCKQDPLLLPSVRPQRPSASFFLGQRVDVLGPSRAQQRRAPSPHPQPPRHNLPCPTTHPPPRKGPGGPFPRFSSRNPGESHPGGHKPCARGRLRPGGGLVLAGGDREPTLQALYCWHLEPSVPPRDTRSRSQLGTPPGGTRSDRWVRAGAHARMHAGLRGLREGCYSCGGSREG